MSYRQPATAWCAKGILLKHQREPENPYDANAIALYVHGGLIFKRDHRLGYISRQLAEELAPLMDLGLEIEVLVLEVTGKQRGYTRGVNILITYNKEDVSEIKKQIAKEIAIDKARRSREARQIAQMELDRVLARRQRRAKVMSTLLMSLQWCGLKIAAVLRYGFVNYMKLWKDPEPMYEDDESPPQDSNHEQTGRS